MSQKPADKNFLECKSCHFVIEDKKLILHLNNKTTKCKEGYSSLEYNKLLEDWCERQSVEQMKANDGSILKWILECRKCKKRIASHKLMLHLRSQGGKCKEKYSSTELIVIFQVWRKHDHQAPFSLKDVSDSSEHDFERYLQLEHVPSVSENCSNIVDKSMKPYYIEKSAIYDFLYKSELRRTQTGMKRTCAILIGYENDHGFHSTELIYPKKQEPAYYAKKISSNLQDFIKSTETFKEFKKSARVLVWMQTIDYQLCPCEPCRINPNFYGHENQNCF